MFDDPPPVKSRVVYSAPAAPRITMYFCTLHRKASNFSQWLYMLGIVTAFTWRKNQNSHACSGTPKSLLTRILRSKKDCFHQKKQNGTKIRTE
uniref:Uncharacterized protein n=1 Tax=Romanomermis culicivorax TaxID=13658 RepID=A0A915KPU8_ROMCU